MKTIIVVLLALVTCAGCRDETTGTNQVQQDFAPNSKSDERVIAIECEITNMPQKLEGKGWSTMHWGIDLANSIMALDDRDERFRLINKCLDAMCIFIFCPPLYEMSLLLYEMQKTMRRQATFCSASYILSLMWQRESKKKRNA